MSNHIIGGNFIVMSPAANAHSSSEAYACRWTEAETEDLAWRNLLQDCYSQKMVEFAKRAGYRIRKRRGA